MNAENRSQHGGFVGEDAAVSSVPRLHADQVPIDTALVRALVDRQVPRYRRLPLRRVRSWGTENAVYRLGDDLAVRLPLTAGAAAGLEKELRWLPIISRAVSIEIPTVVAEGEPGGGYPHRWAVMRWLAGVDGLDSSAVWSEQDAVTLAEFVQQLRTIDVAGFPPPVAPGARGLALAGRDAAFREALARCDGLFDLRRAAEVWDDALDAPAWSGPPMWVHADLIPPNLLIRGGRIAGVLDFGTLTVGDPAYDATAGWHLFDGAARDRYLRLIGADEAARRRARGLVVSGATIALPYYLHTNPAMVATARRGLAAVLHDSDSDSDPDLDLG